MAIQMNCSCGKRLQAEDDQAGQTARCPTCHNILHVPGKAVDSVGYAVEQVSRCPGCKREWPLQTVVCVDCGYNFETGRKMRTKYRLQERVVDQGFVSLGIYTRFRVFRSEHGKPYLSISTRFLFLPLGETTYDLSTYDSVYTDFVAGDSETADVFSLELAGPRVRSVKIFSSSNENKMREVIDLVVQAGRLEIKRK